MVKEQYKECANIESLKESIDKSFGKELKSFYNGKAEGEALEYLKDVLNLEEYSLFDEYIDTETLYKLAINIKEYNEGISPYNPFKDYPMCDILSDFYADFSILCANYAAGLIDKSQIDLSDLESLKIELAINAITQILNEYKANVDYLLGQKTYIDKVEFVNELESQEVFWL